MLFFLLITAVSAAVTQFNEMEPKEATRYTVQAMYDVNFVILVSNHYCKYSSTVEEAAILSMCDPEAQLPNLTATVSIIWKILTVEQNYMIGAWEIQSAF